MPKYAHYDSRIKTLSPVTGWYNTDARTYPNLPDAKDLFKMTEKQWDNRMSRHDWVISNGKLTTHEAPKTLAQLVSEQIDRGLRVTSKSDPNLNAFFAVDTNAEHKLALAHSYIIAHNCFPGGTGQYPWKTLDGSVYIFTKLPMFQAFARAITDYTAALHIIVTTNAGTIPANEIIID